MATRLPSQTASLTGRRPVCRGEEETHCVDAVRFKPDRSGTMPEVSRALCA